MSFISFVFHIRQKSLMDTIVQQFKRCLYMEFCNFFLFKSGEDYRVSNADGCNLPLLIVNLSVICYQYVYTRI